MCTSLWTQLFLIERKDNQNCNAMMRLIQWYFWEESSAIDRGDWAFICARRTRHKQPNIIEIQLFNREKMMTIFGWNFEIEERCKGVHCVDLGESFPTSIYLQKSASIQPRTSPSKFGGNYSKLFNCVLSPLPIPSLFAARLRWLPAFEARLSLTWP